MDLNEAEEVGESTVTEFKQVKDVVLKVLEGSIRSRNEDHYLILKVLTLLGEDITVELVDKKPEIVWRMHDIRRITSFETITRCRREVQNKLGLFPPTIQEVALKRRIREQAIRNFYGKDFKLTKR